MRLDYVSVLAGGRCEGHCPFCVGNAIREDVKPHYGTGWGRFLRNHALDANEFSLSGSTSDPLLCPTMDTLSILGAAKLLRYRISLHTKMAGHLWEIRDWLTNINEICLSVHNMENIDRVNKVVRFFRRYPIRVRISSVYWSGNADILSDPDFYNAIDAKFFTVRKNIFESGLDFKIPFTKRDDTLFGQPVYAENGKIVALWDFGEANTKIKAMYLWPDGQSNEQCFWNTLHPCGDTDELPEDISDEE